MQDAENERPLKRHGSSSDESPLSDLEQYQKPPKCKASEKQQSDSKNLSNDQKIDENAASVDRSQQQSDSQQLYNTSFKSKSTSKTMALTEVVPSPAESILTVVASEISSDFDLASEYASSPSNDCTTTTLSPSTYDNLKINGENASVVIKGDKTPHATKKRSNKFYTTEVNEDEALTCYVTKMADQRECPIPLLSWADNIQLWKNMVNRDEKASLDRKPKMFENHPGLQPRMRAILLDWLIEVCEVYKLQRETFYLTLDYLDRYLSAKDNISKNQLQLIGITCLFIASKVEEIYPPKLHEFAYVTDSACTEDDILQQEFLVLQTLNWSITPTTLIGWAGIYMQIYETLVKIDGREIDTKSLLLLNSNKCSKSFIYPQFTGLTFSKIAQLLDLCSLDSNINHFPYAMVAAAAFGFVLDKEISEKVSGLSWKRETCLCAKWMEPYYQILNEEAETDPILLQEANDQVENNYCLNHICPKITADFSHNIQTHSTSLDIFVSF